MKDPQRHIIRRTPTYPDPQSQQPNGAILTLSCGHVIRRRPSKIPKHWARCWKCGRIESLGFDTK